MAREALQTRRAATRLLDCAGVIAGPIGGLVDPLRCRARAQPDSVTEDHTPNLLGAVLLEPLHLGEPKLRREAHRAVVGGLGVEHHRLAGKRAGEPVECRRARLGGVPACPRLRQEHVAELGLPGIRTDVTRTLCVAPIERDRTDHRSVEIDHEKARAPLGHLRHRALEPITRSRATDVG